MPDEPSTRTVVLGWTLGAAALLAAIAAAAAIGVPFDPPTGLGAWIVRWTAPGSVAALFLVAMLGFAPRGPSPVVRVSIALALLFIVCHLVGVVGLLGVAWVVMPVGFVVLVFRMVLAVPRPAHLRRADAGEPEPTPRDPHTRGTRLLWLAGVPAAAVLLVASASTPGLLWGSEFGGYDALSYHLQLPAEWGEVGRIVPLGHNVYSYLPGHVEAAFAVIGSIAGVLAVREGAALFSAQALHALITLMSAWLVSRAARRLGERAGIGNAHAASILAGCALLATPWIVVVASLAYNEMAVVALGAGALFVAAEDRVPCARRGALTGLLVGAACCAKPTALILVAPGVGVALLALAPRREWARLVVAGAIVGAATLSPWLIRNWLASGNPVFPQLTSVFGTGHWSPEQAARYAGAHHFDGSWLDRLRLIVLPDANVPPDAPGVRRLRGLTNPQWFVLPWAAAAACGLLVARARTRTIGLILTGSLVLGLIGWLMLTHIQSRFLVPLAGFAAVSIGVALASLPRRAAVTLGLVLVAAQTGATWLRFSLENGGNPNLYLWVSPGDLTGWTLDLSDESNADLTMPQYVNRVLRADAVVYLLGDATPLYWRSGVVYNTAWDAWPLGEAIREHPGDPPAWTESLRSRGITHVAVNLSELSRLNRSGWSDPGVTPEAVRAWLATLGRPVHEEPGTGRYLFEL